MSEFEKNLVAGYAKTFERLSNEAKAELVKLLQKPSTLSEKEREELFNSSFGGWNYMSKSTEEIIAEIRGSRHFRDKDLSF